MPAKDTTTDTPTGKPDDDAPTTSASKPAADPQRIVIEQAPAEPAVFYGEGGLVPGAGNATDPDRPHAKADYQPFSW